MENNTVRGVIVENKAGRQALLGKVVIDATGDGDLLPGTGTEMTDYMEPEPESHNGLCLLGLQCRPKKLDDFMAAEPEKHRELTEKIVKLGGIPYFSRGLLHQHDGVVWFHRLIGSACQTDAEEMTYIDRTARNTAVRSWELMKKYMPGFEKSFIMLSAPQLGTSGGRRIIGEYFLTARDMDTDKPFDDTIAVFADNDRGEKSLQYPGHTFLTGRLSRRRRMVCL
jgi:hypothetical protein